MITTNSGVILTLMVIGEQDNLNSNKTTDIIARGNNTEGSLNYDTITVVSHENIPDDT